MTAADVATGERIDRAEKAQKDIASRTDVLVQLIQGSQQQNAAMLTSLDGIRTELRYVNEKIDVLRQDVRDTRTHPRE